MKSNSNFQKLNSSKQGICSLTTIHRSNESPSLKTGCKNPSFCYGRNSATKVSFNLKSTNWRTALKRSLTNQKSKSRKKIRTTMTTKKGYYPNKTLSTIIFLLSAITSFRIEIPKTTSSTLL